MPLKDSGTLFDSGPEGYAVERNGTRLGIDFGRIEAVVLSHGHWDHAGQLDVFPNATLWIQKEELKAIDWALAYPDPKISAWNTMCGSGCADMKTTGVWRLLWHFRRSSATS